MIGRQLVSFRLTWTLACAGASTCKLLSLKAIPLVYRTSAGKEQRGCGKRQ
jgi:hypothetical protein